MTSYVASIWEPLKKPRLLKKRQKRLQAAIATGDAAKVSKWAEEVRLAALAVIQAQRALLANRPEILGSLPNAKAVVDRLQQLQVEQERVQSLSVESIIKEFAGENTPTSTFR